MSLARRVRGLLAGERRLVAIAASVLGSNLVTSALGLVFWMLAARGLVPAGLGMLGAATAAMGFLGTFGCMGLGQLLISELPRTPVERRWELFAVAILTAGLFGALLGAVFGALAGVTGGSWVVVRAPGAGWWWFVVGVALTSVSLVLDNAMLVVGHPAMQVWRNTLASGWKVAVLAVALPLAAVDPDLALIAWVSGLVLGAVMALRAAAVRMPGRRRIPVRRIAHVMRREAASALSHQGLNLALAASWALLPTMIAWVVTPAENGLYTTVRLAAAQAAMLPYALSMALFAASSDEGFDPARARKVLFASLGMSLGLYVGLFLFAPLVLWFFGPDYAQAAVPYLRLMALGAPLLVFKDQFIAQSRVQRAVGSIVPLVLVSAVLEVGLAGLGAWRWHLTGAISGWLAALALQTLYVVPHLTWRVPAPSPETAPA